MENLTLYYWMNLGNYVKNKDKIDMLEFLYKQCKMHHWHRINYLLNEYKDSSYLYVYDDNRALPSKVD